ncbi:MAG: S41 family peptidase [Oscillospiraceae bacterium]|jgi:carboxyl-terminal processing protease|nr:S41 family peptidase [Oscillospiraceae bacterium]
MKKRTVRVGLVVLCILVALMACLPVAAGGLFSGLNILGGEDTVTIPKSEYERLMRFARMDEILQLVERYYIEEPDVDAMLRFAERTMLYPLDDPYTNYLTPEDMATEAEEREGAYAGLGMQLMVDQEDNLITITRVFKNSPAEKAGVLRGDKILTVNGEEFFGNTMQQAVDVMRGKPGEQVTVTFWRENVDEPIELVMRRETVQVNNVVYEVLPGNVGYMLLYEFNGTDVKGFFEAIDYFAKQKVRGLVLDLRDNPGGYVLDCVRIADALVPEGLVVYTEDRYGARQDYVSDADMLGWPLVVLVNEYSASASEILTGAIRDHGVGKVVGTKTFGKGIVQEMRTFPEDGAGLLLTTMRYYTPSGVSIHGIGIEPDVAVEQPEDLQVLGTAVPHDQDVQLKRALEILEEEIINRPPAAQ